MYEGDDEFENYSEVDESSREQSAFQVTDSNESTVFQVDESTVEEDNFMTVEKIDFEEKDSFNTEETKESTEETFEITEEMKDSFEVTETEDDEKTPFDSLVQYMSEHNYGREDYEIYSQDPEWRALQKSAYPDFKLPELSEETAFDNLTKYMSENNYGMEDYDTYSKDPQWQQMYRDLYPKYTIETCGGIFNEGNEGEDPYTPEIPVVDDATTYTYVFEDNWPKYGDFDLNDIVLTLNNRSTQANSNGNLESAQFDIALEAVGASKVLGVGIRS